MKNHTRLRYSITLATLAFVAFLYIANYAAAQSLVRRAAFVPQPQGEAEVSLPKKSDTSPRLDKMRPPSAPISLGPPQEKPIRLNPNAGAVHLGLGVDGALQSSPGPAHTTELGPNFPGLGSDFSGPQGPFQIPSAPPDTTGAVGRTQFVQWVNTSFAVFDKTTGRPLVGPVEGKVLWRGLGGTTPVPCEVNNDGDPIVSYDKKANRWVLSQFSVSGGTFAQCIAVSETSDALGRYFRYEYELPAFNDYPKMGVWRDGYYISYNMFDAISGARACAYDRQKMLVGNLTAVQQCFQLSSSFFGLLPSDLDGKRLPPVGSPNYFLGIGLAPGTLALWRFHADFATPANSTFGVGPTHQPNAVIPVARFNLACSGTGATCIPQPATSRALDSLGERLMFRLAYRNLGDHEALLVNHSVDIGPPTNKTAVRWYELRDPNAALPTVFQQGSLAPDANHRWMGSIAMDKQGNIALGFNVSGKVRPGLRFAIRSPSDPVGIMGDEGVLQNGNGSQDTSSRHLSRWGDYSGLTVDPVSDCTFWYTGEYLRQSGVFNWSTRIAAFKMKGCK
jgi:hypothetical protein